MIDLIVSLLVSALAVYLTALLLPGIKVKNFGSAFWVAIILALLNTFVKPIMVFLTIPITVVTFGLFLFVINALVILLADKMMKNFSVKNFWWALLFSLIQVIINNLLNYLLSGF